MNMETKSGLAGAALGDIAALAASGCRCNLTCAQSFQQHIYSHVIGMIAEARWYESPMPLPICSIYSVIYQADRLVVRQDTTVD